MLEECVQDAVQTMSVELCDKLRTYNYIYTGYINYNDDDMGDE